MQGGDLMLVFDEAHYLFPQRDIRRAMPERINWLMTALINHGVPVALVTTPQFTQNQRAVEESVRWRSDQLVGRIGHYEKLPDSLTPDDLEMVARFLAPEADDKSIGLLKDYAESSSKYLAGIEAVVRRSRFMALKENRKTISRTDIKRAISESVIPSDSALAQTLAAADRSRKRGSKTVAMPLHPQRTAEPATHRETESPSNAPSRSVTPLAVI
ncbi:MAG TPA: zonular occludens toxin domain-containing protein [Candidatus Limnocylindria bacterium]|nr:zonular occludens toxin domain-containing protein [Candidatus Limnocylindria bacterium]